MANTGKKESSMHSVKASAVGTKAIVSRIIESRRSIQLGYGLLLALLLLAGPVPTAKAQQESGFSRGQLDQMLAPIALYPDVLLSQVLMASTYPLEVVTAARWSRQNPGLDGIAAVEAAADMGWDESVKALVAFPDLLAQLAEDLDWTRQLGDAYLYQEGDLADRIQALREQAYAHGSLEEIEKVRIIREREIIYIEPAYTEVVYVPYYDPVTVYGHWHWQSYPPVVWSRPRHRHGGPVYSSGVFFYWGAPIRVAPAFYYSSFDWHRRHIVIVNYNRHDHWPVGTHRTHYSQGRRWEHNPRHRRNVVYSQPSVGERHGGSRRSLEPSGHGSRGGERPGSRRLDRSTSGTGQNATGGDSRRSERISSRSGTGAYNPDGAGRRSHTIGRSPDINNTRNSVNTRQWSGNAERRNSDARNPGNARQWSGNTERRNSDTRSSGNARQWSGNTERQSGSTNPRLENRREADRQRTGQHAYQRADQRAGTRSSGAGSRAGSNQGAQPPAERRQRSTPLDTSGSRREQRSRRE